MPVAAIALVFALASGGPDLPDIESDSHCPSTAQIQSDLAPILPSTRRAVERIHVTAREQRLGIRFLIDTGSGSEERFLTVGPDCASRSGEAAVVIAAWLAGVPEETLPPPDFPPILRAAPRPAPAPVSSTRVDLSAGLLGSVLSSGMGFGGRAEAALSPSAARLALRLDVAGTSWHRTPVGRGRVKWNRTSLGGGVRWRLLRAGPELAVDAGPVVTLMMAKGEGYDVESRDQSWVLGTSVGFRLAWGSHSTLLWLDMRGLV